MLDWDKPLQTVGGKPARFLGEVLSPLGYTKSVAITSTNDIGQTFESLRRYYKDGKFFVNQEFLDERLINVGETA